ncbi:hypothetical protein [Leifsonia sp. Leaf336]|uniref:hypothetical protein n=1 Tax=Leifsonia sp. Leaf336 TaxID=1736341 RepID=UPI0012F9AA00|nr:hypothetical protein [Leifsonia sp. Leaf336]
MDIPDVTISSRTTALPRLRAKSVLAAWITAAWAVGVVAAGAQTAALLDESTVGSVDTATGLQLIAWGLCAFTGACGVSLGLVSTGPFVRFSCWFAGSLVVALAIPVIAGVGMAESPQPNSDIGAAIGIFVFAAPIAIISVAPAIGFGIGIGLGRGLRQAYFALAASPERTR